MKKTVKSARCKKCGWLETIPYEDDETQHICWICTKYPDKN